MAISTIPPWLDIDPSSFVKAGEAGASAGLGASRIRQAGEQHSAQLAMEARRLQQQAAMEAQRLSQAEHIAQMEMETRKEISEQNRIRQDQQALITNAYRQAEMGLEKSRIDQRAALAQQKAQEAALTFAQESSLAQHIAQGGDLATGLMKFPRARGIASALKGHNAGEEVGPVEIQDVEGGRVFSRKGSKEYRFVPNRPDQRIRMPDGSIKVIKPDNSIVTLEGPKTTSDATLAPGIGAAATPSGIPPLAKASSRAEQMMARARQLSIENPSWSKDKVKQVVRDEFNKPHAEAGDIDTEVEQ